MKMLALIVVALLAGRASAEETEGWRRSPGTRFQHGFRVGWMYLDNYDRPTRENGMSLKQELGLKSPHMMLIGHVLSHSLHESGLPNTGITPQQDDVSLPSFDVLPTFQQERDFRFATDQRCEPMPTDNIQAVVGTTVAQDTIESHSTRDTS